IAFAETGTVDADVTVEIRERGIYEVPVFRSDIAMDAVFSATALADALPSDAAPAWADARLYLGVQDTRGLADQLDVTVNGARLEMEPAAYEHDSSERYAAVPPSHLTLAAGRVEGLDNAGEPLTVAARFTLTGADRLSVLPFAKDTSVAMRSNWDSPSFTGGILPSDHTASDETLAGFEANWRVPYLARGAPGAGNRYILNQVSGYGARDMAVRFVQPTNPYQSVERALKYAAMFIGFVFLAYFLFEITSKARAHPAQYILVGLAQSIFYLLLLAFAERMGFDAAFAIAAGMTVSLISLYSVSVFRSLRTGLNAFAILSGIYALIYVLMRAEDHALLAGALASFTAIAVTMYMTRNVDWYGDKAPA
ncbi:MAG: cell envelope integrity protein CreD, partial [Pseudomonadota bacterium]